MEYKRPTKIIDLPSGKKVEIVEYFSNYEMEEIQSIMAKNIKTKIGGKVDVFEGKEIPVSDMMDAYRKAKEFAVKGLIDEKGNKYEATVENIREFIGRDDGAEIDKIVSEDLIGDKKKQTGKPA